MNILSAFWQIINLMFNRNKKDVNMNVDKSDNDIQEINGGSPIVLWILLVGVFLLFLIIGVAIAVYLF